VSSVRSDGTRILVVEDQEDVRRMLVMALEIEGHTVDEAASAADGLAHLEQKRYHLVLSDYAMPGGTGAWMLHEASSRGLMDNTVAVIITAHPDVRTMDDVPIIRKPLDLDHFLDQVRELLRCAT
jgi:two-component system response regulator GlrR